MSQAKVDRYKEQKKNRKQIIKKEKREWMATKLGLSVIAIVLVAWIGISAYSGITGTEEETATVEKSTYTLDVSPLDDYISGLSAE